MTHGEKTLVCVLSGLLLATGAKAVVNDSSGDPYHGIVDRNVFNLKDKPDPAADQSKVAPPPNIILTGITTILGPKQALMKVPVPAKPPEPAHDQSYILAEGERDGPIEVLSIDEKAGVVKVSYNGMAQELTFEKNGQKLPTTPAPVVAGARGAIPMHMPGVRPGLRGNTMRTIPARSIRMPTMPGAQPTSDNNSGGPETGGYGGGATMQAQPELQRAAQMSPAEQVIMIEAEREKTRDLVAKGLMPALPVTPLTPADEQGPPPPAVNPGQQQPQIPLAPQ
jgi:hypothetical protein